MEDRDTRSGTEAYGPFIVCLRLSLCRRVIGWGNDLFTKRCYQLIPATASVRRGRVLGDRSLP